MKFSKKILILMMALAMVFALSVVASAAYDFEVTLDDVIELDQNPDATKTVNVEVPVYVDGLEHGDEGIYGYRIFVRFSDGITWSNAKSSDDYDDLGKPTCTGGRPSGGSAATAAVEPAYSYMESDDGNILMLLVFKVDVAVAAEYEVEVYDITISGDDKVNYSVAGDTTTIKVKGSAPAATLTAIGKNLVLDGGINAKVQFEYTGTETLYINGNAVEKAADGYYYAEIAKSAKDYADEVTFTATASDVDDVVVETSVAAIIDEYQTTAEGTLKSLVDAAETYCSYAAIYFADGTVPAVNVTVPDYKSGSSITGTQDGITLNSVSLILRDKVALRVYFNVAAGTALPAGLTALDATHAYYEKANIAVADLANAVEAAVGGIQIDVIPLAYANLDIDANTANLVKALYNYYLAAAAY